MEYCVNDCQIMSLPRATKESAFSLIELMLVLAVLSTLLAIAVTRGKTGNQDRLQLQCESNLQSMHIAMSIYANDHDDAFPIWRGARGSEGPLSLLVPTYTTDTGVFTCPGADDPPLPQAEPFSDRTISYAYYMGWKKTDPSRGPLASDRQILPADRKRHDADRMFSRDGRGPGANHDKYGGNVLFLDGSTRRYKSEADEQLEIPDEIKLLNPHS